jgi:hypothetical protein
MGKMTNPDINVTHFQVTRQDIAGFAPELIVMLAAHWRIPGFRLRRNIA